MSLTAGFLEAGVAEASGNAAIASELLEVTAGEDDMGPRGEPDESTLRAAFYGTPATPSGASTTVEREVPKALKADRSGPQNNGGMG